MYERDDIVYATREAAEFPQTSFLLRSYFDQDYSIFGNTLSQIMAVYREDFPLEDRIALTGEITGLLQKYGSSVEDVRSAIERIFEPGVLIEGWEGMNARQWLETIAELAVLDGRASAP